VFTRTAGIICLIALIACLACTGCPKKPVAAENAAPPVNLAAGNQPPPSVSTEEPTADNEEQPAADADGKTPKPPAQDPSADVADAPSAKTEASDLNLVTGTTNANGKTTKPSARVSGSDAVAAPSAKTESSDLSLVITANKTGFNLFNVGAEPLEDIKVTAFPPPINGSILLWAYRYMVGLKALKPMEYTDLARIIHDRCRSPKREARWDLELGVGPGCNP
jgi:hypothetical protein